MRWKPRAKPPPGAPWWWPGEQLTLFDPEPEPQQKLFTVASECGCSSGDPVTKRRRRRRAA